MTDYLRRVDWMNSVQAALLVETVAHVIATPIMVMVLTLEAPYCFIGIFIYPIFSEMWMGVYLIEWFLNRSRESSPRMESLGILGNPNKPTQNYINQNSVDLQSDIRFS